MPYFFTPSHTIQNKKALLEKESSKHIKTVLRLKVGDPVVLFDDKHCQHTGIIESLNPSVLVAIEKTVKIPTERCSITLAQSCLKRDKMDWVVQKTTELGVQMIIPFQSSRTVSISKGDNKTERWTKIAVGAAEQSGRCSLPQISKTLSWKELLRSFDDKTLKLILWENESLTGLRDVLCESGIARLAHEEKGDGIRKIVYVIGPEGGFSSEEISEAKAQGFVSISLGKRILRAETAAIAFLAILQHELGTL